MSFDLDTLESERVDSDNYCISSTKQTGGSLSFGLTRLGLGGGLNRERGLITIVQVEALLLTVNGEHH